MKNIGNIPGNTGIHDGEHRPEAARSLEERVADEVGRRIEENLGDLSKVLALVPRLRTAIDATRRDVALILNRLDGETCAPQGGIEFCTLKGTRRAQFLKLCEIKKADPDRPLRACARDAIHEALGPNGYRDEDALAEYAALHRSWWKPVRKWTSHKAGEAAEVEGGAE